METTEVRSPVSTKYPVMKDKDIRHSLLHYLRFTDPSAALFQELPLCRGAGRADCAAINGSMQGYEIKSDADNFSRLEQQVFYYERVFDFCTLVTTHRHLAAAQQAIPVKWGLYLATQIESEITIEQLRAPQRNSAVELESQVRLLWRSELIMALRYFGLTVRSNELIQDLWAKVDTLPTSLMATQICELLKRRQSRGFG